MDTRPGLSHLSHVFSLRLLRTCLLLWTLSSSWAFSAPLNVGIVVSVDSAPYAEIANYIAAASSRNGLGRTRTVGASEFPRLDSSGTHAVVAVGLKALQAVAATEPHVPVICTLIARTSFEETARRYNARQDRLLSAVYLDQPVVGNWS